MSMSDLEAEFNASEKTRNDLRDAVTFLVRITALLLFVTAIPVNIWLWTVAL